VAAGVVAVSFAPLRDALQGAANKLTYGQWSEPGDVLAGIGRRLSDASDVPALLKTLSDELSQTLGLAYVEIVDASKTSLARTGEPETADEIPLLAYGTQVGMLRWSSRNLRDSDQGLLGDVANQLGSVVHAATLLQLVRTAQERLVAAREEERKRLRRDLHDGLGPALAALTLQVDTLRNQSAPADAELLKLRDGIQSTVLDVRRLVEGLRPPAIDELGLSEAVHQLAGRLSKHSELVVTVNANGLPVLPAAVEVAAYRIAQEALTNTVRHSEAHNCTVELAESDGVLVVRVVDDGNGAVAPRPGGLGLASMRERTEEIGGKFVVETSSGTAITARLPIGEAATP
jgi:signal transduction histidine kinase